LVPLHPSSILPHPQRREGKRRKSRGFSALQAGEYTTIWLVMVTLSLSLLRDSVAVSKEVFKHGKKNTIFLVMIYSVLFKCS
jgi:hypothetical protein